MFKINQIVWDAEAKEYVMITTGVPMVEGKPEVKPTEAIALRVCGLKDTGKPVLAFTYRQVKPECLATCPNSEGVNWFRDFIGKDYTNPHFHFLGKSLKFLC
jgi:hypothetical protein